MNLSNFRIISILEGISFLLIFTVSMPLKYMMDYHTPNKIIGMSHGVLFVLYIFMAYSLQKQQNWTNKQLLIIMACSVIPFGTFWMDKKYLKA